MFGFRPSTPAPDQSSTRQRPSEHSTRSRRSLLGFPRSYRLTRGGEIQKVTREGKRIRTGHLDVWIIASPLGHPRVGVVVPRYSGSAADRNRLKRRLRELIRTRLLPVVTSVDVVIRARSEAYEASFEALAANITRAVNQLPRLSQLVQE